MKSKLLYLFAILCMVLTGCNDDDPAFTLSQQEFTDIPCEGSLISVRVHTDGKWSAKSMDTEWITVTDAGKVGQSEMLVQIDGHLGTDSRTGTVVVTSNGMEQVVSFTQNGKPAAEQLAYRIPVVFHVLYGNPADDSQNIPAKEIYNILNKVNQIYAAQKHIKLQFVPAVADPSGNGLQEAGINRVNWPYASIDPTQVMEVKNSPYMHLLWDPNKYVNVLLYNFSIPNILGISTFPLTPKSHPLPGTENVEDMNITLENLTKMRCVSLNSTWIMYGSQDPLQGYVPSQYLAIQANPATTLAHELGHYFGLRHVFSESPNGACIDTDFCADTHSYNKDAYDMDLQYYWEEKQFNPNFANEFDWNVVFQRQSCKEGVMFESHNLMDYAYGYLDEFTKEQCDRMIHVLNYSPLIPGPKQTRQHLSRSVSGPMDLPHEVAICRQAMPLQHK